MKLIMTFLLLSFFVFGQNYDVEILCKDSTRFEGKLIKVLKNGIAIDPIGMTSYRFIKGEEVEYFFIKQLNLTLNYPLQFDSIPEELTENQSEEDEYTTMKKGNIPNKFLISGSLGIALGTQRGALEGFENTKFEFPIINYSFSFHYLFSSFNLYSDWGAGIKVGSYEMELIENSGGETFNFGKLSLSAILFSLRIQRRFTSGILFADLDLGYSMNAFEKGPDIKYLESLYYPAKYVIEASPSFFGGFVMGYSLQASKSLMIFGIMDVNVSPINTEWYAVNGNYKLKISDFKSYKVVLAGIKAGVTVAL